MLKAAEAGKLLGISARKVYALAESGEIACHRFGAAVRFDPADLEEYKTRCRSPATTPAAGCSNLTRSLQESGSALTNYFRKARPERKPTSTTSGKGRGSGKLQLVVGRQNP